MTITLLTFFPPLAVSQTVPLWKETMCHWLHWPSSRLSGLARQCTIGHSDPFVQKNVGTPELWAALGLNGPDTVCTYVLFQREKRTKGFLMEATRASMGWKRRRENDRSRESMYMVDRGNGERSGKKNKRKERGTKTKLTISGQWAVVRGKWDRGRNIGWRQNGKVSNGGGGGRWQKYRRRKMDRDQRDRTGSAWDTVLSHY